MTDPSSIPALDFSRRNDRWLARAATAIIVLATAAAYSNSLHGPFILDDVDSIEDSRSIRSLRNLNALWHAAPGGTTQGRPVGNISLALNFWWSGLHVTSYHVVNLAIHILAALALFGVVHRTLLLPKPAAWLAGEHIGRRGALGLALAIALIWAVHPLQTETVTYVVQRVESLMGLFYLLTFYTAIRAMTSRHAMGWAILSVAACVLGMASKEVMVSAPLLVLMFDRLLVSDSFHELARKRWGLYIGLASTWLVLAWLVISSGARNSTVGFGQRIGVGDYAGTQVGAICRYLRLSFWPHPLVLDYGSATAHGAAEIVPYAVIVGLLIAAAIVALLYRPWAGFLGLAFFAILAPTSSVVPVVTQTMAEHRMYLPLAVVVTLTVLAGYRLWIRLARRLSRREESGLVAAMVPWLVVAAVAASLATVTYVRNFGYASEERIWQDTVAKVPGNVRAWECLGASRLKNAISRADLIGAMAAFDRALLLNPELPSAHTQKGLAWLKMGEENQAIAEFERNIREHPEDPGAYSNRGVLYFRHGQYQLAKEHFDKALARMPDTPELLCNRAEAYNALEQFQLAIKDLNRCILVDPLYRDSYANRAVSYYFLKEYNLAWADLQHYRQLGGTPQPPFLEALIKASGRSE